MKLSTWTDLNQQAKRVEILERNVNALKNAMRPLDEYGIQRKGVDEAAKELYNAKESERRKLSRIARDADEPLWYWADGTPGIGDALFFLLGLVPPLTEHEPTYPGFPCPAALHKYVGLHAPNGRAVRRSDGEFLGFSAKLRAYATVRLVDPVIKAVGYSYERDNGTTVETERSPYRDLYDERKEHTRTETHPPMLDEGEGCAVCDKAWEVTREVRSDSRQTRERQGPALDCSNVCRRCFRPRVKIRGFDRCSCGGDGGDHWTDAHRHNDAVRVTAKNILADAWAVEHGRAPRYGHWAPEIRAPIPAAATV